MKAMKCDRCGKFYEKNERFKAESPWCDGAVSGVWTENEVGEKEQHFDLCDECIDELMRFLGVKGAKKWRNLKMESHGEMPTGIKRNLKMESHGEMPTGIKKSLNKR